MIERTESEKEGIDAKGNKWGVYHIKGSALYEIGKIEGPAKGKPEELGGRFTKAVLAKKEIEKFVKESWDVADQAALKSARKSHRERVESTSATGTSG